MLLIAALLLPPLGCTGKPAGQAPAPAEKGLEATALVMRVTALPHKKSFIQLILVSGDGRVRFGDELDRFRLLDLKKKTVTVVDRVAGVYTVESFDVIRGRKLATTRGGSLPPGIEPVRLEQLGTRTIGQHPARGVRLHLGSYRREIWLTTALPVDASFFAMQMASEPLSETYAGVMRNVMPVLLGLEGVPLVDEAEMIAGKDRFFVQRKLERIEKRRVPLDMFDPPAGFRDISPAKAPDAGRRPASSDRNGRSTRGAESRPSATDRKNP